MKHTPKAKTHLNIQMVKWSGEAASSAVWAELACETWPASDIKKTSLFPHLKCPWLDGYPYHVHSKPNKISFWFSQLPKCSPLIYFASIKLSSLPLAGLTHKLSYPKGKRAENKKGLNITFIIKTDDQKSIWAFSSSTNIKMIKTTTSLLKTTVSLN